MPVAGPGGGGDPKYRPFDAPSFYFHGTPGGRYLVLEHDNVRVVDTFAKMTPSDPDDFRTVVGAKTIKIGDVEITFRLDGQHTVTAPGYAFTCHVVNCELPLHNPGYYNLDAPHELIAVPHIDMSITDYPPAGSRQGASGLLVSGSETSGEAEFSVGDSGDHGASLPGGLES